LEEPVAAIFTLLHLLPPIPQGKGKGSHAKIEDARDLLISFYKVSLSVLFVEDKTRSIIFFKHFLISDWKALQINFGYLEPRKSSA